MADIGQEIGNKLSVKSFGWDKPALQTVVLNDKETDHFLARMGGVATGVRRYVKPADQVKEGEDRHGFALVGTFVGVGSTGEEIKGSSLYLPGYINEMVIAALNLGDDVSGVEIGFDIYARYDAKSGPGYVFVGRDILNQGNATVDKVKEAMMALPMPSGSAVPAIADNSKAK